jgi:D-alanine-D-alanine ligase
VNVLLLHTIDALGPPPDPVLGQLSEALAALGHESLRLTVDKEVQPLVTAITAMAPDLVINMAEAFAGKSALESNVTGLLNLMGCRYTGSSPAGLMLSSDKSLTKQVLSFHGIRTPQFALMYRGALDWSGELNFPVIVKPPQEDASLGITSASVVHGLKDLFDRMNELQAEYQSPVLVEQYIEGREFYVGVLGNVDPVALPIIEMDFTGFPSDKPRIASYAAKWGEDGEGSGAEFAGTKSVFPIGLDPALDEKMKAVAIQSFQALRLRDYARIDLRVSDAGEVYVIEVNPNCYLERESEFARAAKQGGIEYVALVERIIELALARYSR